MTWFWFVCCSGLVLEPPRPSATFHIFSKAMQHPEWPKFASLFAQVWCWNRQGVVRLFISFQKQCNSQNDLSLLPFLRRFGSGTAAALCDFSDPFKSNANSRMTSICFFVCSSWALDSPRPCATCYVFSKQCKFQNDLILLPSLVRFGFGIAPALCDLLCVLQTMQIPEWPKFASFFTQVWFWNRRGPLRLFKSIQ